MRIQAIGRPVGAVLQSLRGKLIAIVAFGVVVPLAFIAAWTTHRLRTAADDVLHDELERTLGVLQGTITRNWESLRGNLELLVDNDVVRAGLRSPDHHLTAQQRAFLEDAFKLVDPQIDEVVFADSTGHPVWRIFPDPGLRPEVEQSAVTDARPPSRLGSVAIELPVDPATSGSSPGTVTALVQMRSLVPSLTISGTNDATVEISDAHGVSLARWEPEVGGSKAAASPQALARRELAEPPLRLVARAPLTPFVAPFEREARAGLFLYLMILAIAFTIATLLAARVTSALRDLATAADAVARGNLEHQVTVRSHDEIARVGSAFNSMTRDLRRSLREAAQRDSLAAVGRFAAELAHEIRNPLTSIRLDLQRVHERVANEPKLREPVGRALSAVDRLNRTVTGALRVARSGSTTAAPLRLRDALEPALETVGATANAREIALMRHVDAASSIVLQGDVDALTQLFTNILFNAAEAVDHAGRIDVSVRQEDGTVAVTVADSGPGIPPEILRQLDEPLHVTTKRGGTGLGLAIARRIAAAHGGRLEFASHIGRGTSVTITLPAQSLDPVAAPST